MPSPGYKPTPLDQPITSTHSHHLHHCCEQEFSSKQSFDEHFNLVHDPASDGYVEPKNHNHKADEPEVEKKSWGKKA